METRLPALVVVPLVVVVPEDEVVPEVPLLEPSGTTVVALVASDLYSVSEREELAAVLQNVSDEQSKPVWSGYWGILTSR